MAFDFVIVGAGSAGCVLAHRLSAGGRYRVLVLEAGTPSRSLAMRVPALQQKLPADCNWLYPAEPDPSRQGIADQFSAGRTLGGSSSINAMLWVRGDQTDYDQWSSAGCEGWDHASVLPYFKRTESFELGADASRGGHGLLRVGPMRVAHPLIDSFVAAADKAGIPRNPDYNGAHLEGVSIAQVNQRRGLRHSAADAYLTTARGRPNLQIVTGAVAQKVILDGRRAIGVEYRASGSVELAEATREVILCAGAMASPKVLLLSGIGPAGALSSIGIPVCHELPGVGRNLQDHPAAMMTYEVNERTLNQDLTPLRLVRHGFDFVLHGRGAITSPAAHAVAFERTPDSGAVPGIELVFVAFGLSAGSSDAPLVDEEQPKAGRAQALVRRALSRTGGRAGGYRQPSSESLVRVLATALHPHGRGSVQLRSADPADPPLVRHELLGDDRDLQALVAGCLRARQVFATSPLSDAVVGERIPGPTVQSAEDWERFLRDTAVRMNHAAGTCRMGHDDMAVVDPALRVRGLDALRIIDASVMPRLPSGNTHAPTVMIAERGSDLVLSDH